MSYADKSHREKREEAGWVREEGGWYAPHPETGELIHELVWLQFDEPYPEAPR
jgi:hypothetical protein